jgi:hypothetical protein
MVGCLVRNKVASETRNISWKKRRKKKYYKTRVFGGRTVQYEEDGDFSRARQGPQVLRTLTSLIRTVNFWNKNYFLRVITCVT